MTAQAFEFDGPRGYRLAGRLELPDRQPQGWAVLAHCLTCGKDTLAAILLARALAARGIGLLRFDFAGLCNSGGSFADTTFAADMEDLVAAGEMPGIRAVATLGAPFDTSHVLRQFDPKRLHAIETQGQAEVSLAGRPFVVRKSSSTTWCVMTWRRGSRGCEFHYWSCMRHSMRRWLSRMPRAFLQL